MFFKQVDLTTALRPSLLPDETLLFVQDAVGLYEGYEIYPRRLKTTKSVLIQATANTKYRLINKVMHI
jgi:hypothetical protein